MKSFLIICILVGLIVFTAVQFKQLILVIKERKKNKSAVKSLDVPNEIAQKKDKISDKEI